MADENVLNSKQRILQVAEQIFAEKGFDGARVGEIAKKADVNKALIYYYFDSKEDILESMFLSLINDAKSILKEFPFEDENLKEEDLIEVSRKMLKFISKKKDILRVAMSETMKTGSSQTIIIEIAEMLISGEIKNLRASYQKKGVEFPGDVEEVLVAEFFTGVLPMLNFVLFKDKFGSYFDIDQKKLEEDFIKVFKKTHYSYHELR